MDIFFKCVHCGQRLVVDDAGIGMEIPCPACAKLVAIPPESTVPPEEVAVSPAPEPKAPEISLPPPPVVTIVPRQQADPPPPPMPAVREEVLVPPDLRAPLAPARVRRPPGSLPPPRAPKSAPALAPSLAEALEPVPPKLRVPDAPRRVRLPPAPRPSPRALQPPPALRPEVLASLKPAEPPPVPVIMPPAAKAPPTPALAAVPPPAKLPPPPPAPKLPVTTPSPPPVQVVAAPPPPPVQVVAATPPPTPPPQGIVPPINLAIPKVGVPPAPPPAPLPARVAPNAVPPPAPPVPVHVAPAPAVVRLVEPIGPAKAEAEQWHGLAVALARQLWNTESPLPLRASVIEAFLRALPRLGPVRGDEAGTADTGSGRWNDPFAGDRPDIVGRFDRPDFEGPASRVAELIERWMQHQEHMARQPGSDAEDIHFAMMLVPNSAVVSFGMNYRRRGEPGRKRVACWVARVGDNRFLFSGKIPSSVGVTLPGFVQSFRTEAGEASVPLPREEILNMPPPPNVDAASARMVRQLMLNFCEAYFVRFDNRLAADFYDQIRRRREIVRAVIPGMLQVMPPSREKRMLQQLSREL